jgi:polygalacturonase
MGTVKTDSSRGGLVNNVSYASVCMRNVRNPLVFDPYYSSSTGALYPSFAGIALHGFHDTGSAAYGGGSLTFCGYDANGQANPLLIVLDGVVFDGPPPTFAAGHNGGPTALPAATHFTLGPGPVSFSSSLGSSASADVTVTGTPGSGAAIDCSSAFVPLSSVLASSPI